CCHPNALMTLAEYLEDYASPGTKERGYAMIERELMRIPKDKIREIAREHIEDIRSSNRRDFRF
ncbi:MAG: [Firmicutes bacterium]|nr:[FeFe] hydrogenase H-cluster radical SAM maturase HydG [Bacillota bacterium]